MAVKRYWKRLLKPGVYGGPSGSKEVFTADDCREIVENGKKLHAKGVLCPLPKHHRDDNARLPLPVTKDKALLLDAVTGGVPRWDPLVNQGFVADWAYLDGKNAPPSDLPKPEEHIGWVMGAVEVEETNTDLIDAIDKGRVRSTSLGSMKGYHFTSENGPEELKGRVPIHVALTLHPRVNNEAGFVPAMDKTQPLSVALLSQEDDGATITELSLLDETENDGSPKPPQNPAIAKAKEELETPSAQPEGDGQNQNVALAALIKACNESGSLPLPPDTTVENVIDRIITVLHSQKQLNGEPEPDAPTGNPPPESEPKENRTSLMSQEIDSPLVQSLLKSSRLARQQRRKERAVALAKRSPQMKAYVDTTINPMIESAGLPAVLLDATSAPVLDPVTGSPAFAEEPIDQILDGLEAAPFDAKYQGLNTPNPQSSPADVRDDFEPYDDETLSPEDEKLVDSMAGYMNSQV